MTEDRTVQTQYYTIPDTFRFDSGDSLYDVTLAYETYGKLNEAKDNAVLLFHALSGSQHAAGYNPLVPEVGGLWTSDCHYGWWDDFIGEGKAIDTSRYFVICANYIGGCYGSTGPRSVNPITKKLYQGDFPVVTTNDIVESQMRLVESFGINQLHAVIGGSLGGMLAITAAVRYPDRVKIVIPIASGIQVSILQRIHNHEQIFAIEKDPYYKSGFYSLDVPPEAGLALARMISHKTFVSLDVLENRARDEILEPPDIGNFYRLTHTVESYMRHQGEKFIRRFDANSYLRIINAWQNFNLLKDFDAKQYSDLFRRCGKQKYLVFSISSDVCFYPDEQQFFVSILKESEIPVQYITVNSDKGHDSFLLEPELYAPYLSYALGHS